MFAAAPAALLLTAARALLEAGRAPTGSGEDY